MNDLFEHPSSMRHLVEMARVIVLVLGYDGRVVYANPYLSRITGYPAEEIPGCDWFRTFLPKRDRDKIRKVFKQATQEDAATVGYVNPILLSNGEERLIEWYDTNLRDDDGKPWGLLAVGHDVTERQRTLRRSELNLAEAQRIAHLGSWEWIVETNQLHWSDEVYRIFGLKPQEFGATYPAFLDAVHPDDRDAVNEAVNRALADPAERYSIDHRIVQPRGQIRLVHEQGEVTFNDNAEPIRMVGTVQDITETRMVEDALRARLAEKELLLQEIHHRVKNNLQIVSSLLHLQERRIPDVQGRQAFAESRYRINAMALVHESLYQAEDLSRIDFKSYLRDLTRSLTDSLSVPSRHIRFTTESEGIDLGIDAAIPCGLLLNELITNALQHAFVGRESGEIHISLRRLAPADSRILLEVRDDGVGMPEDLDLETADSLGLRLVTNLTRQLGGKLELSRTGGTCFRAVFDPTTA